MPLDDVVRLQHMLDAAREALGFSAGRGRADLDGDRMLTLALVKCIEIIGEAAANVSPGVRVSHPEIPWREITSMRNRLIHAYFDVDLDVTWSTTVNDLPPLVAALQRIILSVSEEG
jgi:uncharacterized protein with HEPN domain